MTAANIILNGGSLSALNTFSLDSNRGIAVGPSGSGATGSGSIDVATNVTLTYGGTIADNSSGKGGLTKTGLGTLSLSGANTWSGDTVISSGTLQVANPIAIPTGAGKGNVNVVGTLDLNNNSIAINGLSGTGIVSNTKTGSRTLTVGGNDQSSTFAGVIQNGNGTTALSKTGTGKLTLTQANTFTGGTTVSVGTLELGDGTTNGSVAGNISDSSHLVINNGSAQLYTGIISGPGTFEKAGPGTLTLNGTSSYTGATSVSAGTLLVNGALGNSATTIASGATLGGTGFLGSSVTVNGTLSPGDPGSIGSLGINSLDLTDTLAIQWNGTTDTIDQLNVTSLLQLRNSSSLVFSGITGALTQPAYVFATYGTLSSSFSQFGSVTNLPAGYTIDFAYGPSMNQIALVVPEPRSALLGGIGLLILLQRRRDSALARSRK